MFSQSFYEKRRQFVKTNSIVDGKTASARPKLGGDFAGRRLDQGLIFNAQIAGRPD
jgi:hypothetical protein